MLKAPHYARWQAPGTTRNKSRSVVIDGLEVTKKIPKHTRGIADWPPPSRARSNLLLANVGILAFEFTQQRRVNWLLPRREDDGNLVATCSQVAQRVLEIAQIERMSE